MIDAASTPCFLVREGTVLRRASLLEILTRPGLRLSGPTPMLEAVQLMVAAAITADVLDGYHSDNMSDVAAVAADRIKANPERHRLDGDGFRYRQVRLEEGEASSGFEMQGHLFPNFSPLAQDSKFRFGWKSHNSWHGFCPCCTLLGLTFVSCFASGTGGKTSGPWKNGVMTFPVLDTLASTVALNALAWDPSSDLSALPEGLASLSPRSGKDPWADPAYLKAVAESGTFDRSFKTIPHLRALTPWAMWANWETVDGLPCALCGLPSDVLCTSMVFPKQVNKKYKGKLGWPKSEAGITDAPPSPHHASLLKDDGKPREFNPSDELISVARHLFSDATASRGVKLSYGDAAGDPVHLSENASLMVLMVSNDHKGLAPVGHVSHIPLVAGCGEMYDRCSALYETSKEIEDRLKSALGRLMFIKANEADRVRVDSWVAVWKLNTRMFVNYLGPHDQPRWKAFLRKEALAVFDRAAQPFYEQGYTKDTKDTPSIPLGKIAAQARLNIIRS